MKRTSKEATPRRRSYTPDERRKVMIDLAKLGLKDTARKYDIPKTTICNWKRRAADEAARRAEEHQERSGRGAPKAREQQSNAASPAAAHQERSGRGAPKAREQRSSEASPAQAEEHQERSGRRAPKSRAQQSNKGSPIEPVGSGRAVARRYTPSERARALEHVAAHGVSATARELGISRFALYSWQRQLALAVAGEGPSPTSGPDPADIEAQRDREILGEWKKHPGLGPSQVRNQLRRRGIKVSVATVRRVMEDAGYRPPKIRREPHDQRYEAVRPNGMWHLDYVHRFINKAGTHSLILIDDFSRFVVGYAVDDAERSAMVLRTFEEAVTRHGKPEAVMHDKGSAFWSWSGISKFTGLLTELGIDQVVAEHKEHNGKIEVFNGNLTKEFFGQQRFYDVAEMRKRLGSHLRWYNHGRTHHALGGLLVPADRYFGRADEVLARIEAGALREGDELGLSDRGLELLKVVSKGGVPEVWLCGQRLWSPKNH